MPEGMWPSVVVALWLVLLVQGLLLVVLGRHMRRLNEDASFDPASTGLAVGAEAPEMAVNGITGAPVPLGGAGAGKTSVLRVVAGLIRPGRGGVSYDGEDWTPLPPERRRVGLVFQDYALFPHLSVRANVAYAGPVGDLLDRFHLAHLADAKPGEISGGERQRVALARALARDPAVLYRQDQQLRIVRMDEGVQDMALVRRHREPPVLAAMAKGLLV